MLEKSLIEKLIPIALQQMDAGFKCKEDRMKDIAENEEFYNGKKYIALSGRWAIALPTMRGFIDQLMSKIDEGVDLLFRHEEIADLRKAQKVSAFWRRWAAPDKGNWNQKDRWEKKLATFSGRAISKHYGSSKDGFTHHYEVVDHLSFYCEPDGGADLNNHKFMGQIDIFKTATDLKAGAEAGIYIKENIDLLNTKQDPSEEQKKSIDRYKKIMQRWANLGLDIDNNKYLGQQIFSLVEHYMEYEGEWYYLLFEPKMRLAVRADTLENVIESGEHPYVSWATNEDPNIFWSPAPADPVRPIAEAMDVFINQELERGEINNFGHRAYDPEMFENPEELRWRPDGLAVANTKNGTRAIGEGIFEFSKPQKFDTIGTIQWLNNYMVEKLGIMGPGNQDQADQKVGVFFGILQQAADQIGLVNKSYRDAQSRKGTKFYEICKEHLTEPEAVNIIGLAGLEWDEVSQDDLKPNKDFSIVVMGGNAEAKANEMKLVKKEKGLNDIANNQIMLAQVNPQWLLREKLGVMGYEKEETAIAISVSSGGLSLELMSEAELAIQMIIAGKRPKINRKATVAYLQYINDFAFNNTFNEKEILDKEVFDKIMAYIQGHMAFARRNELMGHIKVNGLPGLMNEGESAPAELPAGEGTTMPEPSPENPPTPMGAVMSRSQQLSAVAQGA